MMARGYGGYGYGPMAGRFAGHGFFPLGGPMFLLVALAVTVLLVVVFWRIYAKAGFPGVLGLLMLVPGVNLGAMAFLAFAEWPALAGAAPPAAQTVTAARAPAPAPAPAVSPAPAPAAEQTPGPDA